MGGVSIGKDLFDFWDFSKIENSSDVKCTRTGVRRGRCSQEKTGPPQEAPVGFGETGETELVRRAEGDAQAMPGETAEVRRAEGAK